jgi:hypothetical protein
MDGGSHPFWNLQKASTKIENRLNLPLLQYIFSITFNML